MRFLSPKIGVLLIGLFLVVGCTDATNKRLDKMNDTMDRLTKQVENDQVHVQALDKNSARIAKQAENYEKYVKTLTEELKIIADSMVEFKKMGIEFSQLLKEQFKPVPPSPTPDIEDILK